jgi:hypothetical protein
MQGAPFKRMKADLWIPCCSHERLSPEGCRWQTARFSRREFNDAVGHVGRRAVNWNTGILCQKF